MFIHFTGNNKQDWNFQKQISNPAHIETDKETEMDFLIP